MCFLMSEIPDTTKTLDSIGEERYRAVVIYYLEDFNVSG